jgi:hypothetical protein
MPRGLMVSVLGLAILTPMFLAPGAGAQIWTQVTSAVPPGGITELMRAANHAILKNNHGEYFTITMAAGAAEFSETEAPPAAAPRPNMLPDGWFPGAPAISAPPG